MAKAKTEAEKQMEDTPTIKMYKDDGSEADVHPDEVENYKKGDWKIKD